MTNKGIRKRKEVKFKKRSAKLMEEIGPITEDNFDTIPIGNPYGKSITKSEMDQFQDIIKERREKRLAGMTPEEIQEQNDRVNNMITKWKAEDKVKEEMYKRKTTRRLFIKK